MTVIGKPREELHCPACGSKHIHLDEGGFIDDASEYWICDTCKTGLNVEYTMIIKEVNVELPDE